jgi:hypothetical protein
MSDIYAMQRANGDVFALDNEGRFCVPLFHSSRDAMTARMRNGDMLLFKPVALDARLLQELELKGGQKNVDLLLVKDPLRSLKRGDRVDHAELVLIVGITRNLLPIRPFISPRIRPAVSPLDVKKMVAGEERLTIWVECVIQSGDSNGQSLYS